MGISCTLAGNDASNQNKYGEEESGLRVEREAHWCSRGHPKSKNPQREQGRSNLKGPMGPGVRVAPEGRGSATGRLLMCSQEPLEWQKLVCSDRCERR